MFDSVSQVGEISLVTFISSSHEPHSLVSMSEPPGHFSPLDFIELAVLDNIVEFHWMGWYPGTGQSIYYVPSLGAIQVHPDA